MIISEPYIVSSEVAPYIKIYSDKHFYLQSNGILYEEAIIESEEQIKDFIETNIAIPAPIANDFFISSVLVGENKNITQKQILEGRKILSKALDSLSDDEAYKVKFLFEEWDHKTIYKVGQRIVYNNTLYNVIKASQFNINPDFYPDYFEKVSCPIDLVEEWNELNRQTYNLHDRVRVGEYVYESLIDNNSWSPREFPAGWKIVE